MSSKSQELDDTLGDRGAEPKGSQAQRENDEVEHRPGNERGGAVKQSDPQQGISESQEDDDKHWTDVSDEEKVDLSDEEEKELERRYKECTESEVFMQDFKSNTRNRRHRFAAILDDYSEQNTYDPIVDASDTNAAHDDPKEMFAFVPCMNGTYVEDGDRYRQIPAEDRKVYCGCPVWSNRLKNGMDEKPEGSLGSEHKT